MNIDFISYIDISLKNEFANQVINKWNSSYTYYNLPSQLTSLYYGYGGFSLSVNRNLLFKVNNNKIIGLESTNKTWSDLEINLIIEITFDIITDLNNKYSNVNVNANGVGSSSNSNITLVNTTNYYFSYMLPKSLMYDFIIKLLNDLSKSTHLKNAYQSQTGLIMQLDPTWRILFYSQLKNTTYRELNYIYYNNEYVIGFKSKDNIPYFTQNEIHELLQISNNIIDSYNLVKIPTTTYIMPNNYNYIDPNKINLDINDIEFTKYKSKYINLHLKIKESYKEKLLLYVFKKSRKINELKKLEISSNSFYLPTTSNWTKYTNKNHRKLTLVIENNYIIGLKFSGGTSLWSNDEVDELLILIEKFNKLYK